MLSLARNTWSRGDDDEPIQGGKVSHNNDLSHEKTWVNAAAVSLGQSCVALATLTEAVRALGVLLRERLRIATCDSATDPGCG